MDERSISKIRYPEICEYEVNSYFLTCHIIIDFIVSHWPRRSQPEGGLEANERDSANHFFTARLTRITFTSASTASAVSSSAVNFQRGSQRSPILSKHVNYQSKAPRWCHQAPSITLIKHLCDHLTPPRCRLPHPSPASKSSN